jgi:DnaJ-class molecular chaperone
MLAITQIKKAFRTAAVKHHPDKGGDPELFKKMSEAYAVLRYQSNTHTPHILGRQIIGQSESGHTQNDGHIIGNPIHTGFH